MVAVAASRAAVSCPQTPVPLTPFGPQPASCPGNQPALLSGAFETSFGLRLALIFEPRDLSKPPRSSNIYTHRPRVADVSKVLCENGGFISSRATPASPSLPAPGGAASSPLVSFPRRPRAGAVGLFVCARNSRLIFFFFLPPRGFPSCTCAQSLLLASIISGLMHFLTSRAGCSEAQATQGCDAVGKDLCSFQGGRVVTFPLETC